MKKIFLFLCVIGATTLMTSCFDNTNQFVDEGFVYIAESENAVQYGRFGSLNARRLITSPEIRQGYSFIGGELVLLKPGQFYYFQIRWEESNGTISLGQNREAYEVSINSSIAHIPSTWLILSPTIEPVPPVSHTLTGIGHPQYAFDAAFWDDYWVINFGYVGGVDPPTLAFNKRDPVDAFPNSIEIDVRVMEPSYSENPLPRGHTVVLNMADIRKMYQQDTEQEVRVRFHYYRPKPGQNQTVELRSTSQFTWRIAGTAAQ